ncbi:unnamed protein product [Symbiodinium natans]|uniref:Apple domain-containing protein n=1 Tax=Symbiodinium natans TaxID=878477 RepID=A0A812P3X2_9DINO|nr:unnamed protein product [Symbiodinium natans]
MPILLVAPGATLSFRVVIFQVCLAAREPWTSMHVTHGWDDCGNQLMFLVSGYEECCFHCQANPECRTFIFRDSDNFCWLKNADARRGATGCFSRAPAGPSSKGADLPLIAV